MVVITPPFQTQLRHRHRLDEHFDDVAAVLRLDKERRALAESAARELEAWITADTVLSRYQPWLYPQGSFLLRTTVRPRADGMDRDEFDLDLVMELCCAWNGSAMDLFNLLWQRIRLHPQYGKYAVRKRRCVRINFPGEFHLDVLPARADVVRRSRGFNSAIEIPDCPLQDWTESDPRGFAEWFERRSRESVEMQFAMAKTPMLIEDQESGLDALRKSVQLTKRHRDVVFNGSHGAPRSIVITTLLASHYFGWQSPFLALRDGVKLINEWVRNCDSVPAVINPVNEEENFADAWDIETFSDFKKFINAFVLGLAKLEEAKSLKSISDALAMLFDEHIAQAAMRRFGARQEKAFNSEQAKYDSKENARIVIVPGAAALSSRSLRSVPKGTNFGAKH